MHNITNTLLYLVSLYAASASSASKYKAADKTEQCGTQNIYFQVGPIAEYYLPAHAKDAARYKRGFVIS